MFIIGHFLDKLIDIYFFSQPSNQYFVPILQFLHDRNMEILSVMISKN